MTETPAPAAGRSPGRDRALRLAVFVSPHGFGHAARTCSILEALRELEPALEVTLFTSVPRWFFVESLSFEVDFHELTCDVGLVQRSAVEEDLPATVELLEAFWTEAKGFQRGELQRQLRDAGTDAVLCDISPLGLAAARDAGLPSILVENFTWDWIYEPLVEREPRLAPWVSTMRELFALAELRIQAEPICEPLAAPVVHVPPIARRTRSTVAEVRARLGLAPAWSGRPMILVSMGGIPWSFENLESWRTAAEFDFVVPGGAERERHEGNLVLLPHHSPVYHPDLVAAADVVVGKLGYSTVAEAVAAGTRMLFCPRPDFREHPVLAEFVDNRLPVREVELAELASGAWISRLPLLLGSKRAATAPAPGAAAAARAMAHFLEAAGR